MIGIQRYRLGQDTRIEGGIFTPSSIVKYTHNDVWITKDRHKRGGWCKWDDVKILERKIDELEKENNELRSK